MVFVAFNVLLWFIKYVKLAPPRADVASLNVSLISVFLQEHKNFALRIEARLLFDSGVLGIGGRL